jgi:hypothetical protein
MTHISVPRRLSQSEAQLEVANVSLAWKSDEAKFRPQAVWQYLFNLDNNKRFICGVVYTVHSQITAVFGPTFNQ